MKPLHHVWYQCIQYSRKQEWNFSLVKTKSKEFPVWNATEKEDSICLLPCPSDQIERKRQLNFNTENVQFKIIPVSFKRKAETG